MLHSESPEMPFAATDLRSAAALAVFVLAGSPALAQGTAEQRSACMGDAFSFCASDIPDVPAIEACLIKNESKISPACRAEFHPTTRRTRLRREHFSR
jgi:hypothetical protein